MHCQGCSRSHFRKTPHKHKIKRPPPGHTLVTDIAGPLPKSGARYQYFLNIIELHSRMKIVYLLKTKTEAGEVLTDTMNKVERHFGHPIARIRCDNANEYLTKTLVRIFGQRAVALDPTTPHTPEENAVSERLNRTIMARVRATLHAAHMSFAKYWPYFVLDTVSKANATLQQTIEDIPRRVWNRHSK